VTKGTRDLSISFTKDVKSLVIDDTRYNCIFIFLRNVLSSTCVARPFLPQQRGKLAIYTNYGSTVLHSETRSIYGGRNQSPDHP
jgi:hypothetical protein